jgi:hypothetical protein
VSSTAPIVPFPTFRARAARQEDLDRDAISFTNVPAPRGAVSDAVDHTDRLMTGYERVSRKQLTGVLLVIGSTQTARFYPQQCVVVADRRERELVESERSRRLQHGSAGSLRQRHVPMLSDTDLSSLESL